MKNAAVLFLSLLSLGLKAQVLEEQTSFSASPRGEAIFELAAGQSIYTYQEEDSWYKARKVVYLRAQDISEGRLSAGAKLYNEEEEVIGQAKEASKLYDLDTIEAFRGDDTYRAVVQGYIFETKLEEGSVPEEQIEKIMAIKNRTEQGQLFDALWEANEAESEEVEAYTVWVIRENNKTTKEEKDFRLIMVFRGSSTPYAIITKGHEIELPKVKEFWEDGQFRIYYLFKSSESQKAVIEDLIYQYLAL